MLKEADKVTIHGEGGRAKSSAWLLDEGEVGGEAVKVFAKLTTSHSTNRKAFFSTLRVVKVTEGPVFTSEAFWVFDGVAIGTAIPVGRFSKKGLTDAHAAHLAALAEVFEHAKVQEIFGKTLDNAGDSLLTGTRA